MADIPGNIANKIAQRLVDGAIRETRYLCCFGCIAAEFEKEKENLKAKLEATQQVAKEATRQNKEILNDVKQWMEKARNRIEEDTKIKKSCFFVLFPNCIGRYRKGKKLQEKIQEIKSLIEKCRLENIALPREPPGMEFFSSQGFVPLESRKLAYAQLLEELRDGKKYMIGLQAMGGSGKTTLAKEVGKEIQESKIFYKVIFVVISNPPNIRTIQDDIASALGPSLNGNEQERRKELWYRIRNEKKILLILDDVWEKLDFEDIGIPYRDQHEGCCILLTTRELKVCNSMGCQRTIQLELLPEEEAWFMFQKFAGISDDSSPALRDVAPKIASECGGLPIAIRTMASTLKDHRDDLEYWRTTLTILQSPNPIHNIQEDLIRIYNCLHRSYENLKCEKAKGLFLLCSMFPEDHEIHTEELIRCGIGLGLFGELDSYRIARFQVKESRNKLTDSSLLLEGEEEGCVKMHDLLRDVAHWIRNYEIHETKALQENSIVKPNKVRYLYCHNMNDFSCQVEFPALEILILACNNDDDVSIPDAFFGGMKCIRVFTLKGENSWSTNIQLRPTSIEVLKNLRSLDLRNCNLGDIFVFGSLQRIETLELYRCSINELPNGILGLKKLRLFRLQSCEINENPYRAIGRFSELEELYLMNNRISNGEVDRGVVSDLFEKSSISRVLERYHIEIGVDNDVLEEYLSSSTARALSIGHFDASISNAKTKEMMQRAEILCLCKLKGGCKTISPDFATAIGGAMSELIKLGLYDCSEIEYLVDTTKLSSSLGTVFSNLITLTVYDMDNLKDLCHGTTPSGFLEKLEHLTIERCGQLEGGLFVRNFNLMKLQSLSVESCSKLTYIFTVSIAESLVLLKDLEIRNCDSMEYIIEGESEETMNGGSNKRTTSDIAVSSTDSAIINCNQLQNRRLFGTLQKLIVNICPKLTYLFTVTIAQSLVLLEGLYINHCDAMKCIIKDESGETVDVHQRGTSLASMFPKLQRIVILSCGQLECLMSVGGLDKRQTLDSTASSSTNLASQFHALDITQTQAQSLLFNNVRDMELNGCPQLKWVFTLSNATTIQLESLHIERCDGLKHIIMVAGDDDANYTSILPNFRQLDVYGCKQLEQIVTQVSQDSNLEQFHALDTTQVQSLLFNNVRYMTLIGCPKLKWVFIVSNATTMQLEYLDIKRCDGLKHIIIVAGDDDSNYTSILPNFRRLWVEDCKQLEQIVTQVSQDSNLEQFLTLDTTQVQSLLFNNVREMVLFECPQLKWVFTLSNTTTMQLEYLKITKCDGLKHIIIVAGDDDANYTSILPNFRKLYVRYCKQLKYVFGRSHHEDNSSYQNRTSNLEIQIRLPALERVILENLPHMISICTERYHARCPSLKEFDYKDCPQFAKTSIIDFIDHSEATLMKCNQEDYKELLEKYKKELQTEEEKFSKNVSPHMTERKETEQESVKEDSKFEKQVAEASSSLPESDSIEETMKQSVQKIPAPEKVKKSFSSLVDSEPRDSQSTKGSTQEDLASTKVEIETPPCPPLLPETSSLETMHDQPRNQEVPKGQQQTTIIKEASITDMPLNDNITDTMKQSIQEDAIPKKSKIATSSTNYEPGILSPGSLVIPIEDVLSKELMENEEVDFHGLFKIDPRRSWLLDEAFAKYPHLWEWQQSVRPKFCRWGYESLSDMLVFLKEKTPKALMDESSKEEFEKLYAELKSFRFDKNWLASIRQRVMGLQVDNEKLKHLVELEAQMNNMKAGIARIKDDLISKYEAVFDF